VIAEGRISTPEQAGQALALGAHAVVVGSAITRPQWITAQFAAAIQRARET
jgi:N-acylglucosamine-6-phosphate 2-epimerase